MLKALMAAPVRVPESPGLEKMKTIRIITQAAAVAAAAVQQAGKAAVLAQEEQVARAVAAEAGAVQIGVPALDTSLRHIPPAEPAAGTLPAQQAAIRAIIPQTTEAATAATVMQQQQKVVMEHIKEQQQLQ